MANLKFSKEELTGLLKAWLAVSMVFYIAFIGITFQGPFLKNFIFIGLITGTAFILHELSHKFVAVSYGYSAEFKSFDKMLLISILISFFGFIFLAPGAVFIFGNVSSEKNGKISLAGPLTNLVLALMFLFIGGQIGSFGFRINSWLAFFNMLPFFGLDGEKVLRWNPIAFGIIILLSGFLAFF